jgi:hypothetical protein
VSCAATRPAGCGFRRRRRLWCAARSRWCRAACRKRFWHR